MTLPKKALQKVIKDELVNLSLDYQSKLNSMVNIDKDMGEMRKHFEKREADLVAIWVS